MSLTILQPLIQSKRVVLVDLGYPYGKKVYMSGSVVAVAAQLMAAGHKVDVVDFNIDNQSDDRVYNLFSQADVIGGSVMGSPGVPLAKKFANQISRKYPRAKVVLGGQVTSHFSKQQFRSVFGTTAMQVANDDDHTQLFGALPSAYQIPYSPVWRHMGDERLQKYLEHEFALVLSQGCMYKCTWCSAPKGQKEAFRDLAVFQSDLQFLLEKAKGLGIRQLECYASSLDFFQTPKVVCQYLEAVAEAQEKTGVRLRTRCLSCMNTFLAASRQHDDFPKLIRRSGLWCVGFGVDGTSNEEWKEEGKTQNKAEDIEDAYDLAHQLGLRSEVLTVMGQHSEKFSIRLLLTMLQFSWFVDRWSNTVLRPYVYRGILPGNDDWEETNELVKKLIEDPRLFYNLDICGLANSITHPNRRQRWLVNLAYLFVIAKYSPSGRCATSPLLPQGEKGLYGLFAKIVNRLMPFDR
jgi:hypothetical protein